MDRNVHPAYRRAGEFPARQRMLCEPCFLSGTRISLQLKNRVAQDAVLTALIFEDNFR